MVPREVRKAFWSWDMGVGRSSKVYDGVELDKRIVVYVVFHIFGVFPTERSTRENFS